uniref:NADH dehydrogenase subunit 6 n=1 Tax=Symplocodes ridleyi TaxID=2163934 RepID=UPI0027A02BBC|nr:NADH dehydrogenase subunit 6 [Symplocodes ridleyi]WGO57740.1 NADH dehydrogenase subunit 6 [Symplocodes ridleyi]
MKLLFMYASTLLSIMFTQSNHPLSMGLILLLQTILISLLTGMISQSFWFSYILFLIFLGGMLILFMYVTSLASNEMFSLSYKMILLSSLISIILTIMYMNFPTFHNPDSINVLSLNNTLLFSLIKLYNQPNGIITILVVSYLFLTLIVVVKIINIFKGPLRQMN